MQMEMCPRQGKGDEFHQLHALDLYRAKKEQLMISGGFFSGIFLLIELCLGRNRIRVE